MKRIARTPTLFPILCLTLLVLACSGAPSGRGAASSGAATADDEDRMAPGFTLSDLDGGTVSLADSAGQVRLIDFWATWCAPCREEIPMFNELQKAYGDQGLTILGVSEETAEAQRPFVEEYALRYTSLIGTQELAADYGVFSLPTAFLIDRDGRIVDHFIGPKPRRVLEEKIRTLLDLPPQAS